MMTDIAPSSPRGYVLAADQGLVPDRPDLKAGAGSTGGQLSVFTVSVDGGPPRHTHTREDESIYLFSGLLEVECDDEEFEVAPGSFVFLPGRNIAQPDPQFPDRSLQVIRPRAA
jgi:quercetin dioxygenase-like cupin family protein